MEKLEHQSVFVVGSIFDNSLFYCWELLVIVLCYVHYILGANKFIG